MSRSVTLKGSPISVSGPQLKAGDKAPSFTLSKNLKENLESCDLAGKVVILSVAPSLDTPVCDLQGKRFNQEAGALGAGVAVVFVSRDLPPAQARWCGANDAKNLQTASDFKFREFGLKYGVEIADLGVLARAVFVVGKDGKIVHAEYVPEIAQEPNYDAAIAAAKKAL